MADADTAEQHCEVPGCTQLAAVSVPAILARELLVAPAEDLVQLCADHAQDAEAPERPTN